MKLDGFHFALLALIVLLAIYFGSGFVSREGNDTCGEHERLKWCMQGGPDDQESCSSMCYHKGRLHISDGDYYVCECAPQQT